jgi:uncharacterized membrane protein
MKKKKLPILVFVFLLIISFVNAQSDFNIISDPKIELCPCSNQAYNILLQNTGSSSSNYKISESGQAADWVSISPSGLTLNPGTATNLQVNVNSPCDAQGDFDLETFVTADGLTKKITQDLNFLACYDYDVNLGEIQDFEEETKSVSFEGHENGYEVCEETQKIIPVLIENKESYGNTYEVSFQGQEWSGINAKEFNLAGNAQGILLLTLKPGAGSEGDYKLKLDTTTKLGEVKKSTEIDVKVEKCFDLSLDIEKEKDSLCGGDLKNYNVEIKNNGKFTETLDLGVEGSDFASIENITELTIGSKEKETLNLNVKPGASDSGNFNVNVIASNEELRAEDSINFDITQRNVCYKADIEFKALINNKYTHEVFPVTIFNNGIRQTEYEFSIEGPSWASLLQAELELNPGQKGNVNLNIDPGEDAEEGTFDITIKAEINDEVYSKTVKVNLKKENPIVKNIKSTIRFYQYYAYVLIVLIFLVAIFWIPARKQIKKAKEKYARYKQKQERQRALREEKRVRKEEADKKKEEEKARKEREERKKIEARKRAEKTTKKKERKKFFSKAMPYLITIIVLVVLGALIYAGIYFDVVEKIPKESFNTFLNIVYGAYAYLYYIIAGIILVIALIYAINRFGKKKKKKASAEKKPKKRAKKTNFFKKTFVRIAILILIALLVLFSIYGKNLVDYVRGFVILYLYYFITGIVVLMILIFLIRFYKPILDFLMEEDKNNKK